jgi:hypothetical protein
MCVRELLLFAKQTNLLVCWKTYVRQGISVYMHMYGCLVLFIFFLHILSIHPAFPVRYLQNCCCCFKITSTLYLFESIDVIKTWCESLIFIPTHVFFIISIYLLFHNSCTELTDVKWFQQTFYDLNGTFGRFCLCGWRKLIAFGSNYQFLLISFILLSSCYFFEQNDTEFYHLKTS